MEIKYVFYEAGTEFFNIIYENLRLKRSHIRHGIGCQAVVHEFIVLLRMCTFSYIVILVGCRLYTTLYPMKCRVLENQFN
jgi:hypothetical protein